MHLKSDSGQDFRNNWQGRGIIHKFVDYIHVYRGTKASESFIILTIKIDDNISFAVSANLLHAQN